MRAKTLSECLRKVRIFAKENGSVDLTKNVKISGTEKVITFICNDGDNYIIETIKNDMHNPIMGECCIDVFKFSKYIDGLSADADIKLIIKDTTIQIKGDNFKSNFNIYPSDRIFPLSQPKEWNEITPEFFQELEHVTINSLDEDTPIINAFGYLYYANPKACIILETKFPNFEFMILKKYLKKMNLDDFKYVSIDEGRLYFKNDTCQIALPIFAGKQIQIVPLIKMIKDKFKYKCYLDNPEIKSIVKMLKAEANNYTEEKVRLSFSKNALVITSDFSEIKCNEVTYDGPDVEIIIAKFSLEFATQNCFKHKITEQICMQIAENATAFVLQNNDVIYAGSVYRRWE